MKRSFQNFKVSEVQIPQSNIVNFKRVRQDRNQKNLVLQKIHTFFTKIDALNIEYISRRW